MAGNDRFTVPRESESAPGDHRGSQRKTLPGIPDQVPWVYQAGMVSPLISRQLRLSPVNSAVTPIHFLIRLRDDASR